MNLHLTRKPSFPSRYQECEVLVSETRMLRRVVSSFFEAVDALVFPWQCPICGAGAVGAPFCVDCRRALLESVGAACPRCALPLGPWADRKSVV